MCRPSSTLPALRELLPPERISLNVSAVDWRDAVRQAGYLLLRSGAITEAYIDAMLEVAESLKQYIVIAPGIALPHARPEAGAVKTAMSLVKLVTPIEFGNLRNDPVRLVFALAAVDKTTHTRALQMLAELFLSEELMGQLFNADSVSEIERILGRAEVHHAC